MKQVMKYQSRDGKLWDEERECREHELAVTVSEHLVSATDVQGSGTSLYEIVRVLIRTGYIKALSAA